MGAKSNDGDKRRRANTVVGIGQVIGDVGDTMGSDLDTTRERLLYWTSMFEDVVWFLQILERFVGRIKAFTDPITASQDTIVTRKLTTQRNPRDC